MTHASSLLLNGLELNVHLGCSDHERSEQQVVTVDIDICFANPPKACVTDDLNDSWCYATLIKEIQNHINGKAFHLIEHLSYEIYNIIKPLLAEGSRIIVRTHKHPPIEGFSGQVRFSYGNDL